jgi:hypothetical protein
LPVHRSSLYCHPVCLSFQSTYLSYFPILLACHTLKNILVLPCFFLLLIFAAVWCPGGWLSAKNSLQDGGWSASKNTGITGKCYSDMGIYTVG